jgi:hypothetical protein
MKGVLVLIFIGYLTAYIKLEQKIYGFAKELPSMEHKTLVIWSLIIISALFALIVYPLDRISRQEQAKVGECMNS